MSKLNIGVKRIITLSLILSYIVFVAYGVITNTDIIPESYVGFVSMVIGYYFGNGAKVS